jgi:hypothetical protein
MNKEQAKERLCAIETEVEKLRRIIDEPERKPKVGDVWKHPHSGANLIILKEQKAFFTDLLTVTLYKDEGIQKGFTYLGKFDEVYVKASDVREVLSIKDEEGDTLEECAEYEQYFAREGCKALVEKLKSIIK